MVFPTRASACVRVRSSVTTSQLFAGAGTLVGSAAWAVSSQRSGSFWIKAGSSSNRSVDAAPRASALPRSRRIPAPPPSHSSRHCHTTAPPPTALRRSTPRADVPATRDEHLRQLADLERRQTGRRDGDQRPPRDHDPGRPRPLYAGHHVARPPPGDEHPQFGDDPERSRRPPHRRASRRARSGTSPRRGTRAAGRPSRG